jgi:hypothetical protein
MPPDVVLRKQRSLRAFLSEACLGLDPRMDTGSREENAPNQNHRAALLIPSGAERLEALVWLV